jgi:hypothetical protein
MRILKVDELYYWWDSAYRLHVDGFHEAKLRSDDVRLRVGDVKALVNLAKKMLKAYYIIFLNSLRILQP